MKSFGKNESYTSSHLQILYHQTFVQLLYVHKLTLLMELIEVLLKFFCLTNAIRVPTVMEKPGKVMENLQKVESHGKKNFQVVKKFYRRTF